MCRRISREMVKLRLKINVNKTNVLKVTDVIKEVCKSKYKGRNNLHILTTNTISMPFSVPSKTVKTPDLNFEPAILFGIVKGSNNYKLWMK